MMRALLPLLVLAGVAPGQAQDTRPADVLRYVEWLADTDPQVRELAAKKLAAMGPGAVPALERLLSANGAALEIHKILTEIEFSKAGLPSPWVSPKDLPSADDVAEGPSADAEKYVNAKFAEALTLFKKANYSRAYDISNALVLLEPGGRRVEEIKKLRRACDTMITQTAMIRSKVLASAASVMVGEPVQLGLRMDNVSPGPLKISYGSAPAEGYVVLEIRVEALDPITGSGTTYNRSETIHFENPIEIAMGAQWERFLKVDTAQDFPADQDTLRRYTVSGWTQPVSIESPGGNAARRLVFEPAVVFAVPRKYEHLVADPVASLGRAVDVGTVGEVFICAMLAPAERRNDVISLLVDSLQKAESGQGRVAIAKMLIILTEQKLGDDPRAWKVWWDKQKARPARQ